MGFSRAIQRVGVEDILFWKKKQGIFRFVTLPLKTVEKASFHPWKFCKIVQHLFEKRRLFHLNFSWTLLQIPLLFWLIPEISTCSFFNTPRNFMSSVPPVWTFPEIAHCLCNNNNNVLPSLGWSITMGLQICEPQTYEIWVITFYSDSATAVSSTGHTMFGVKSPENVWLFEPSRLPETVTFF